MAVSDGCVPNFVKGPFERALYKLYDELWDNFSLRDNCMTLDELFFYMEDIVGPIEALEKALSGVDWIKFTPWDNTINFLIDDETTEMTQRFTQQLVYVYKDDSKEILSLIEYLDGWEEGCELCHLLEHWAGNIQFQGEGRSRRFRSWISTYPALFACEERFSTYPAWAVKWIGMQCRLEIGTRVSHRDCHDTSPNVASAASSAAQPAEYVAAHAPEQGRPNRLRIVRTGGLSAVTTRTGPPTRVRTSKPTRAGDGKPSSKSPPTGNVYLAGKRMRSPR